MIEHILDIRNSATDFSQCQRLFHGRGHSFKNLEHVNVDWFLPVILITLYQEVEQKWLDNQAQLLKKMVEDCRSVLVQYRCRKFAPTQLLLGEDVNKTVVNENGLNYHIEFGKAQNAGLFLDMRNGREWVKANTKDAVVLNLFAYTCAFSVAALAGGAEKVVNVDLSKASLTKGRENHRLNQQDTKKVVFEGVDIFKSYGKLRKYGPYDLLIADPPSFQKGSVDIERDYAKIIRRIPQLLKNQGKVMLCLNSPDLDEQFLLGEVQRECPDCQWLENIPPPLVFKEAHKGKGLKVMVFVYNQPA